MKQKNLTIFYSCLFGSLLILSLAGHLQAQSFLHSQGTNMVDEKGKVILLKGVGLGNWMLPEGYMWKFGEQGDRPRKIERVVATCIGQEKADKFWKEFRKNYITENDIKRIAELGYNSVRPALNSRLFITEGENNVFVDEGFQLLDNLIAWCKKYKIYVIIDMHGAPGGQTGQNIDDSPNNEPELFMNPKNQDLLEKLWVKIADRYKNEPTVAAYDLLNEPLPENTGAADKYKSQLIPVYERLIKAIRAVDNKHMFTVEGFNWANNWSLFDKPLDNNIIYQFHYYCWNQPDNLNDISYYLNIRNKLNTPVWVGETGEKNNTIYFATTQYFEQNNIGWSFWPWKKMDTKNTPYSIKMPVGWDAIMACSRTGQKPASAVAAEKTFNELLNNIKLENCTYFPDVVNAMFRRLPLRLEAENFGHQGVNISYAVNDTSHRAQTYRVNEPVTIKLFGKDNSEQAVELQNTEWTAYQVYSPVKAEYRIVLHIRAIQPGRIVFSLNEKQWEIKVLSGEWTDILVGKVSVPEGGILLKVRSIDGIVQLDRIDIK